MLTERLELLLQTQSFAQLSAADRAFVLRQVTAEEYAQLRLLLGDGVATLRDVPQVAEGMEKRLENHLAHTWTTVPVSDEVTFWRSLINYRVPLWQPLLGAFLLLFYIGWQRPARVIVEKNVPQKQYVYRVDTVYKERQPDTVQVSHRTDHDTAFATPRQRASRVVNVKPSLDREIITRENKEKAERLTGELPTLDSAINKYVGYARGRSAQADSSLFQLLND